MNALTLTFTADQAAARDAFVQFFLDPLQHVFVLAGYSGTGKTTLVQYLLKEIPKLEQTIRLINPNHVGWDVRLTATTNKAAEALAYLSGQEVRTIHSTLGLRVQKDYRTNETTLAVARNAEILRGCLLVIDEASFVDDLLLKLIFQRTEHCKIVFIGDPAQLKGVKVSGTPPVFAKNFPGVEMRTVVRHDGPILDLATKFRETVLTGEYFSFKPDGQVILHLPREQFYEAVKAELCRPDWKFHDSKVLAWTNKRVQEYNAAINSIISGTPEFQKGDYATVNSFVAEHGLKTDQTVLVTGIQPDTEFGYPGYEVELENLLTVFVPLNLDVRKQAIKDATDEDNIARLQHIDNSWVDLRAVFSQTIDKSQGSTYDKVFIDLDDVARCTNGNQIARLLYVGVSRARQQVFLTGDLV